MDHLRDRTFLREGHQVLSSGNFMAHRSRGLSVDGGLLHFVCRWCASKKCCNGSDAAWECNEKHSFGIENATRAKSALPPTCGVRFNMILPEWGVERGGKHDEGPATRACTRSAGNCVALHNHRFFSVPWLFGETLTSQQASSKPWTLNPKPQTLNPKP